MNKCELGKAKRSLEEVDDEDAASISSAMSGAVSRRSGNKSAAPSRTSARSGGPKKAAPRASARRR